MARCVHYTRAGSAGAAWWEATMAGVVTFDFFAVPVGIVAQAYMKAIIDSLGEDIKYFKFTYLLAAIDVVFLINIFFRLCQVLPL